MKYLETLKFTHDFWLIVLPCVLMVLDIITGYYNAWKSKKVSSKKMRDGLGKKLAELVYIVISMMISSAFGINPVKYFIALYIVYMELVSISENCKKLGVPMPEVVAEKLSNKDGEENGQ